ncbi:uncharacterized protein BDZ99DRAFT_537832 [Mytilinidion resinicola]|uniref:BTB domain-containing protein n=1 Tax=Mytilinidion resinicola TaxID=574789 RepID=A0A6A6YDI6_9PEZI|nr:uncharacterized protein BDZ99DRAFT_537832 [Mytilinidion resinicola]KAF2806891.1 hypothetical protein BDZ99DRAFT_537832 [Mytilinidion resinicola]
MAPSMGKKGKNIFPSFDDGDVEIKLSETPKDVYILHSFVLALHSPFFKTSLSERWAASGDTALIVPGSKIRWKYELRFEEKSNLAILTRDQGVPPEDSSKTELLTKTTAALAHTDESALFTERQSVVSTHRQLLGLFYTIPPKYEPTFEATKTAIVRLVSLADMYTCTPITTMAVENLLYSFMPTILNACHTTPTAMISLATEVKSTWIFKEAATHLIGFCVEDFEKLEGELKELHLLKYFQHARSELRIGLMVVEQLLFVTPYTTNAGMSGRLYTLFREFLSVSIRGGKGSGMKRGYAQLYHQVANGEWVKSSTWASLLRQHNLLASPGVFPTNSLSNHKGDTSAILQGVLKNCTRLKKAPGTSDGLTCIEVDDKNLPWNLEDVSKPHSTLEDLFKD